MPSTTNRPPTPVGPGRPLRGTRRRPWSGALLLALLLGLSAACVTGRSARRGGLSEDEVAKLPPAVSEAYRLFAQKCSRCHTLARPLGADIDEFGHWERYVARMRRQRGSGISAADGEKILVFLKYYTEQRLTRAEEDAP